MTDLIDWPERTTKPRATGRTHIIDKGTGLSQIADELAVCSDMIDLAKIGWATALVLPDLTERIELYRSHDIDVCCGGSLYELCVLRDRVEEFIAWLDHHAITTVEISSGTVEVEEATKLGHITRFAERFQVFSEVGSKDPAAIVSPARWVAAINAELDAGASHVILEGRESGTSGLYRQSGEIRMGLVDEVIDSGVPPDSLVFEATQKDHQTYLIDLLGTNINLANIPLNDVVALETLRLGFRADTMLRFHDTT